ncbi:hypothetical protein [Arsenicicoccus bolidensis]|uniref:Transposase DDE domain-containing protein n=1 Tax=Arsenicicoccus bolidensis TaxID=229480 RepID=A0ABS9Q2M5_9MICO|nr:hypothetical protein [Arsenicicoccus bolidensis]MCG7321343.1 hypothetical protein [Arsenicicoccus bolidensis]
MSRRTKNRTRSGPAASRVLIANELTRAQQIARAVGCADNTTMRTLLDHAVPRLGRPRKIPLRSIAILLALHAIRTGSSMIVSQIVRTAADLTPSERRTIGIPAGIAVTDKRIRSGVSALIGRSAVGVHIPHDHPEADPATGEVIDCGPSCNHTDADLDEILTDILLASLPDGYRAKLPTAIAIDGTDIESHYRRKQPGPATPANQKWDCIDTEVALGKRTPTDRRRTEFYVGYEAHIATILPSGADQELPLLATGLAVRPGVRDRNAAAMAIIRRLGNLTEVLADRAYTTAKPERWARPLRSLGISNTKDLHETQRGVRPGPVPGTIWLDGRLHSAAIPTDLRELQPPRPGDSATVKARRRDEFDRRRKYEFVAHKAPDPVTGAQRFKGPALAGRVRCRNIPKSMRGDPSRQALTACQKGTPCGCGATVTVPVTTHERDRQPLPWQSTAWAKVWNRRSRIEGLNGLARYQDVNLNRGYIRCRGRAATGVLTAFALLGMNIRRLYRWHTTRGLDDPWRLALNEEPDTRPLDHYYRTDRRSRSPVTRQ